MKNQVLILKNGSCPESTVYPFHHKCGIPTFKAIKLLLMWGFFLGHFGIAISQVNEVGFINNYAVDGETAPNQSDGSVTFFLDQYQNSEFQMFCDYKIPGNPQIIGNLHSQNGILVVKDMHPGDYFNVRLSVLNEDGEIWSEPIENLNIERSFYTQFQEVAGMQPEDSTDLPTMNLSINCPTLTFTHCNGTTVSRSALEGGFAYNISPADRTCGFEVTDSCTVENVNMWLCIVGNFPPPLPYSQFTKTNYQGVGLDTLAAARIAWIICHYEFPETHQHPIIKAIWKLTGTGGSQNEVYWAAVNAVPEPDGSENHLVFYKNLLVGNQDFVSWQCCEVDAGTIGTDQEICYGVMPEPFQEITAASGNSILTYQWQQSTEGCDAGFTNIDGATEISYQMEEPGFQTMYFRRKVTNTIENISCESYSNCLVLTVHTVNTPVIDLVTQPSCYTPFGSVLFSGLPDHPWTLLIQPGNLEFFGNTPVYSVSGLLPGTVYFAEVIDSNNCHSGISEAIIILPVPPDPAAVAISNSPICAGSDIQLSGSASGGTAPYTYQWTGPDGFISNLQNPVLPNAFTTQSGTYVLTVTDAKGCTGNTSVAVAVNPNPAVTVTSNSPVCAGTNVQLTCSVSSGTAPYTYQWTGPNGFVSTVQNPVLIGANTSQSGTYLLTVMDAKGCIGSNVVVVVVNSNPIVTAGSNSPVCTGSDIQLSGSASGGTAPYTYQWTGPYGFISNLQNPVLLNAQATQSGTYVLTVTDAKGCTGNASVVVVVNPNPAVTATSNSPVCAGTNVQLTCSVSSGTAPYTYQWTGPNAFVSTVQNPVLIGANTSQSGTYLLTVMDAKGCIGSNVVVVVVNSNPIVTAGSNSPVCAGSDLQLTGSASGGTAPYIYQWSGPDGFISNLQNPVLPNALTTQSGTYVLTVTDAKGCTGNASVVVVVNPNPAVTATSNSPVCAGTNVQLTCSVSGGTAPYTYQWTGPNGFVSTVQNPVLIGANTSQSGTYLLTVMDAKGCIGSNVVVVVVNSNPIVAAGSNSPVCAGSDIQLTGSASGGTAPYTYQWTGPNGFVSNVQNPVIPGAQASQSGTYVLTVTDAKGCSAAKASFVLVYDIPEIVSVTPSNCDPISNTYSLTIITQYYSAGQGNLVVRNSEGNQMVVPATGSPQNIIWQGLPANGNAGIDLSIYFEQTPQCGNFVNDAYDAPEDCSCVLNGIEYVAVCNDGGTQNPEDDHFSIKIKPVGYGYGNSYQVIVTQSGNTFNFGPFVYGSFTPYFGQFLIADGDLVVSIADLQFDCGFSIELPAPETCSSCTHPVLTAGHIQCNGQTYDVFYYFSEGAVISTNAGNITDHYIYGIPIGTDLEINADLYGCVTKIWVESPDACYEDCDYAQITLGQPACQGSTYSVSFTWDGLGNMSRNAGIIQGDRIIQIPIGVNLIVTVTNGDCITQIAVESPESCGPPCENPFISLSGPLCRASESDYYSVNYALQPGTTLTVSAGIIGSNTIYHIPINHSLTVTVQKDGCDEQIVVIPPPVCEDDCTDPVLTVGDIECVGETYNVFYYHSVGSVIQVNAGTIEQNRITGIPLGIDLEIIAREGACLTILKVASPQDCDQECDFSVLTVGQPVCVGSTYSVSFTWDGLGNLTKNAGKIRGNQVIDIPLGIDLVLTVTNGACITKITVTAPVDCDCIDPCRKPLITLSGPVCGPVGSDHYSVSFFIRKGVTVLSSAGIVGNGVIYQIPNGVAIQVIARWPGCEDQVVLVPAPVCEQPCISPMLTVGNVVVGDGYFDVDFWHSIPAVIAVNAGTIENNQVTGVPEGTMLTVKAIDGACETEIRVSGPEQCLEDCIQPELSVGQGVCTGESYKVSFVWNGVGELTRNSGILAGNEIINIPLGVDLVLTANNCDCSVQIRVVSPKDCSELCDHPAVSVGGTICSPDNNTYSIVYSADPFGLISADRGVIGSGQIHEIAAGLPVSIISGHRSCAAMSMQIPAPSCSFSSIGNFVWHDLNGDGLQNAGEPGIEGVALRLYDGLGNVIKTTQSNSGGFYEFGQLIPGEYFVEIVRPEDYSDFTLSKQGMDPAKDSNFDHANGYGTTSWIFLGSKAEDNNIDAGLYQCAEIAGQVWFDENQNDVLDTEEIGINGLQVKLFRREHTTWTLWDYIYTQNKDDSDEAGHWNFCVNPGEYYLEIPVVPVGMTVVLPFAGTDPEKDSDLTGANGVRTTDAFTVGSGQQKTAIGAGFSVGSTLGNLVWFDENSNGYLDENESGMPGVSVDLFDDQGQEAGTVSTDDAGEFVFEGLKKGIYFIRVYQPQGYTFTTPKTERDDANGSDVNHANGWGTTSLYPLEAGESILLTAGLIYASLPVELTEFSGENHGDHNVLTWTTEREENSDRFILERKHASEAGFKAVGTVMAKGNGVEKQVYSFEDHQLPITGVYYYRLDQRDKNGTKKYSKIIALEAEKEMTNDIAVFPNPARGRFEVRMALQEAGLVNMELLDSRGIAVRKDLLNSLLEPGQYVHVVELNGLSAGMYQLKVQTEKLLFMERVIVIE